MAVICYVYILYIVIPQQTVATRLFICVRALVLSRSPIIALDRRHLLFDWRVEVERA